MLAACHLGSDAARPTLRGFWDAPQGGCEVEVSPPQGDRSEWLWEPAERSQRQQRLRLVELLGRLPAEWHQWTIDRSAEAFTASLREGRERLATVTDATTPGLTGALRALTAAESLARQLHEARVSWDVSPSS